MGSCTKALQKALFPKVNKMELKTLRDFELNPKSWAGAMANAGRKYSIDIPELREEAIKWVHHLRKANKILKKPNDTIEICWIIQFFNLKEKELNTI